MQLLYLNPEPNKLGPALPYRRAQSPPFLFEELSFLHLEILANKSSFSLSISSWNWSMVTSRASPKRQMLLPIPFHFLKFLNHPSEALKSRMFNERASKRPLDWIMDRERGNGIHLKVGWRNDTTQLKTAHCGSSARCFSWCASFLEPGRVWSKTSLIEPDEFLNTRFFYFVFFSRGPNCQLWILFLLLKDFKLLFPCQVTSGRLFFLIDTHFRNANEPNFQAFLLKLLCCVF